jgi:hypothetical protein
MGRSLDEQAFKDNLVDYLDNQLDHIPVLIRKLSRLSRIVKSLKGYRFYGSSLLLIYDGSNKNTKIDVRMIDFAKSVCPDEPTDDFIYPPKHTDQPDQGYLLGLQSLIDCFNSVRNENK